MFQPHDKGKYISNYIVNLSYLARVCGTNFYMWEFQPIIEDVQDSVSVVKKSVNEPVFKRPRIETPSPLPTFKVRYIRSSF